MFGNSNIKMQRAELICAFELHIYCKFCIQTSVKSAVEQWYFACIQIVTNCLRMNRIVNDENKISRKC